MIIFNDIIYLIRRKAGYEYFKSINKENKPSLNLTISDDYCPLSNLPFVEQGAEICHDFSTIKFGG